MICPIETSSSPPTLKTVNVLEPATRFALADLTACVLRLDFWDDAEPSSIFISKLAFEITASHLEIPEKVTRSIKMHLEGEESLPDIAALITTIKNDGVVSENGSIFEDSLATTLVNEVFVESNHSKLAREKKQRNKKIKRFLLVGAAGGLTGGLAAPLVAAGAGVIIGSGAAGLATTAGAAVLGTTFGVAGAGLAGYKVSSTKVSVDCGLIHLARGCGYKRDIVNCIY
ncbi:hypothetical protein NECAME_09986 [Necator americanus]|uniref:Uncharacterized protein n=1 Tax=Necator americanus TaxID=51031 RepID=W2TC26_NECAM|nr:hypothetical protein NECAME_09986 [Necator americanus]ETN79149.1 hypothetical protein NECAME_09986 [Necator americanus]